jgi:hypothetical protein
VADPAKPSNPGRAAAARTADGKAAMASGVAPSGFPGGGQHLEQEP